MPSDRSLPISIYSPTLPGTEMVRLYWQPVDRGYLRGLLLVRLHVDVNDRSLVNEDYTGSSTRYPGIYPRASTCRRVRPVPSERILHRKFCQGSPYRRPSAACKVGGGEAGRWWRTTDRILSHYRRPKPTRRGLGQWERGPCSTTNRTEPTEQGSSSDELAPYRGVGV